MAVLPDASASLTIPEETQMIQGRARLAATLSRWSHFAAEGLGADVQQLQGQTKSVNAELAEYRCNVEVEGRMKCFVLSLGTAVQRQQMIALRNLQSKGQPRLLFKPAPRT
ncbi:unnamed protein product [Durusdinium trenchii]|uniref:Uncharacterized protein n=1 Tax=Durusdinium trenchii TaxID=1381693 RepID=A0ABP0PVF5_9DINO